jgi:hypothetical protein
MWWKFTPDKERVSKSLPSGAPFLTVARSPLIQRQDVVLCIVLDRIVTSTILKVRSIVTQSVS